MVERQGQDSPQHGHDQGKQSGGQQQQQQQNDPKRPGQQGGVAQPHEGEPGSGQSGHDKGQK
jgi:hypothetical protein